MNARRKHLYMCVLSLVIGLLFYVFFKPNSILNGFAEKLLNTQIGVWLNVDILNNHFCDFLWGFSLTSGLIFILGDTPSRHVLCAAMAVGYGCLWEILQYAAVVPGTGDWMDILTYLTASILVVII